LERDKEQRPRKKPARKITPDGLEERSENIGDTSREDFNIRTEHRDAALGRAAARDTPGSVHDTISRHKKQTQRFTEHAAKPIEAQTLESGSDAPAEVQPPILPAQSAEILPDRDKAVQQRSVEEARPGATDAVQTTDTPLDETVRDTEPPPQAQESLPDGSAPARDAPLRHEHAPRSAPDRPGRLRFGGAPAALKETPRRKPASPDAAKYTPPDAATGGDSVTPAATQPAADSPTAAAQMPDAAVPDAPAVPAREPVNPTAKPGAGHGSERSQPKKPGKLQFTKDETPPSSDATPSDKKPPGRKLEKAQYKAERSGQKLEKARKNLPKKRSVRMDKTFDEKSGKAKRKFRFEEEVKSQHEHIKGPLPTRPVKAGANAAIGYGHRKIYQVEHENVGTQAAHKAELLAEGGLRSAYRLHKTAPYRKVEKLERRTTKLNIKASYQQALHDNPKLNSNMLSRAAHKRKIKKEYAKAAREAKKTAQSVKKTGDVIGKAGQAVVRAVTRHPAVFGIIASLFLLVVIISSLFTSCSNMASGIGSSVMAISYLAEDADVDNAELYYTEWETDLQMQIGRAESDYPSYDEYRYQADNIGHNPYELMSYLTVAYQDFRYTDVEAVLRQIFAEQYQLTFTPSVETRYADPTDADDDGDYEPYDWHVLTVTLTSRSFTDVIYSRMSADQLQHYNLLMRSKGARQYAGSTFDFNWLPYATSYYGYRVHPTSGAKDYHKGIDIGVPTGTDIHAAHDGIIATGYDAGGYGYYITLTGADGLVTKYAHCDSLLVSAGQAVKAGDVIAKSGNSGNSTGPHLHFEVIKNGQYLNPLYFSQTNDSGAGPVYGDPGAPMGDGSYAALIAEAERHLGKPYVWGTSGPNSFDCSGFVCSVLNQSGVASVGRTTAQGLYNICTPVSPADAQPGDLIFFTGTYSAATPVTHVGIYVGGGIMIHCGNPIQYTSINTSYWQSHFYSFGRLN